MECLRLSICVLMLFALSTLAWKQRRSFWAVVWVGEALWFVWMAVETVKLMVMDV